jgi:UDP-glucuronate 4-epimerase
MGRVLVTGAAGFIGSHLCERLLARGDEVIGVDSFDGHYARPLKERNLTVPLAHPAFRLVEADLVTADLAPIVDGVGTVFHLAGKPGVRDSWGAAFPDYLAANVVATQRLLDAVRETGLERFMLASTSSVYGNAAVLPMREDAVCRPYAPYGLSKMAAEETVRLYLESFGVPGVVLRFFTAYGPRQRPDMGFHRFITAGFDGEPVTVFGDGGQTRDFTFVTDVVEGMLVATAAEPGSILNVGGGHNVTLLEALDAIGDALGRPLDLRFGPRALGDVRDTQADSFALRSLGWAPDVTLADGIAAQVAWMRNERAGA